MWTQQPDQDYKYKCNTCEKSFRLENALKFHNCRTGSTDSSICCIFILFKFKSHPCFFVFMDVIFLRLQMTRRSSVTSARGSSPPTATSPSTRRSTARSCTPVRSATRCSTAKTWCRSTTGGTVWVSRPRAGSEARSHVTSYAALLSGEIVEILTLCWVSSRCQYCATRGPITEELGYNN